jgi:hypothetical protein
MQMLKQQSYYHLQIFKKLAEPCYNKLLKNSQSAATLLFYQSHRFVYTLLVGGIRTKSAQGAITGAISAGITYGIGHGGENGTSIFNDNILATAAAHGSAQGIIAQTQGGSFQQGFITGSIGHITGVAAAQTTTSLQGTSTTAILGRTTIAAMFGGVASQATGGSFSDGAYTAAVVHLFNREGDILKLKLKMGLNAGVKTNIGGVAKLEVEADGASGNRELVYNHKEGWRVDRSGSQGVGASVEVYKYKFGYSENRTHPVGQPKNWSSWKGSIGLTVNNIPLDGILSVQAGAIIQPGIGLDLKELYNWWHDK